MIFPAEECRRVAKAALARGALTPPGMEPLNDWQIRLAKAKLAGNLKRLTGRHGLAGPQLDTPKL